MSRTHRAATSPSPPVFSWTKLAIFLGVSGLLFVLAMGLDLWAYERIHVPEADTTDWGGALRAFGYWPTWIVVGLILIAEDRPDRRRAPVVDRLSRGLLVIASAGTAGLAANLGKLATGRLRPEAFEGVYEFRPLSTATWSASGLGLPSGHTAVAFGAAWMLCLLHPRLAPVWILMGMGTAAQRVMTRAHYLSDTVLAACVAFACAWLWWRLQWRVWRARRGAHGIG